MNDRRFAPKNWIPRKCPKCGKRQKVHYQPASDTNFVACLDWMYCGYQESVPEEILRLPVDDKGNMVLG